MMDIYLLNHSTYFHARTEFLFSPSAYKTLKMRNNNYRKNKHYLHGAMDGTTEH
jgi:hypothetical protein